MNATVLASALGMFALLVLDVWAIWSVVRSSSYSIVQRLAQAVVVVLFPFVGAWVVLYFAKSESPAPSGHYSTEYTDAEDVAYASDCDVGNHGVKELR